MFAAGCHNNNTESGYGIMWVSVTDQPGDYSSYVVTIDSITLLRTDGAVVTAVGTPEIVDFAQLNNIAELWGSNGVPNGTYVSATIQVDYTSALIAVQVAGVPRPARVVDFNGGAATTYAVTVNFDPEHQPTITPTYSSTSALRLAIEFNLAASGRVDTADPLNPTVYVRPFLTAAMLPADTKITRVRGVLINSSTDVQTFTLYVRPFYDNLNSIGTLSLFSGNNTVYTVNGITYQGPTGLAALGLLSAGGTVVAGYTTFSPDYNAANGAYAGKFNLQYVVGASTLQDNYTEGLSGDVVQRIGNTLLIHGATLILNTADTFTYIVNADAQVLIGPNTIVTADNNTTLKNLNYNSVAVGQHISARGLYSLSATGVVILDATGNSSANTGAVRLQATEIWGPLVASAAGGGSLDMNVQYIDNWPVTVYDFSGNGSSAANTPVPSLFKVDTGTIGLPVGTTAGNPVWVYGFSTPFGTAPPDYTAVSVNNQASVQVAGGQVGGGASLVPGNEQCGAGSQVCDPASMEVLWLPGTLAPFSLTSTSGFVINLANPNLSSAVLRIGPEEIDMKSLPASPQVVPTSLPATNTFAPAYTYGDIATSTTIPAVTSTTALVMGSDFTSFLPNMKATISDASPALQMVATGIYNRATNTFIATSIDFVL